MGARSLSRTEEPGGGSIFRKSLEDVKRTRQVRASSMQDARSYLLAKSEQHEGSQRAALPIMVPRRSKKEQLLSPARGRALPIMVPKREEDKEKAILDEEMRLDAALADDDNDDEGRARSASPLSGVSDISEPDQPLWKKDQPIRPLPRAQRSKFYQETLALSSGAKNAALLQEKG